MYLDADLANQLRYEFHARFWEMYLVDSLLDSGKELEKGRSQGPDICIQSANGARIWIEAVTATPGSGADAVQESQVNVVRSVPNEQIKLRLLNAFDAKFVQIKKHKARNIISNNDAYIIAINAAQVPSARLETNIPRIVASLLPFGDETVSINVKTSKSIDSTHNYQDSVSKYSGAQIQTMSFCNGEYFDISAVIYSCVDALHLPEKPSQGLLLFHNPLAKNPLPLGFLGMELNIGLIKINSDTETRTEVSKASASARWGASGLVSSGWPRRAARNR